MADGGIFPWKVQKIFSRGPAGDYGGLRDPLPKPPDGMIWHQDRETREWKLVPEHSGGAGEEDWEILSDKISNNSSTNARIVVTGSVRSVGSYASPGIKRSPSSSTIDSADNALGPLGKGVLGVDYVEHVILPSDTLQGICLAYKINTTRLRQANHFSGNSLVLAPKKLVIPMSKKALRSGCIRVQDTDAKEYKLHSLLAEFPDLSLTEAKAYLELSDWVLKDAMRSAKEDNEWEQELDSAVLRPGDIRITMNSSSGFNAQGAGIRTCRRDGEEKQMDDTTPPLPHRSSTYKPPKPVKAKVTAFESMPSIATKSVKAQDVYNATTQHANFGVELQPLTRPLLNKDGQPS